MSAAAKQIQTTTSRIFKVLAVPVADPAQPGKKKLLPVWQGEPFVALKEVEELGLPRESIKSLLDSGDLQRYYMNGVKKFENDRRPVYISLRELRELFT